MEEENKLPGDISMDTSKRNSQTVMTSDVTNIEQDSQLELTDVDPTKAKIVGFTTDDFKIRRMVSSTKDLPLGKYTSLGAILQQESMKNAFQDTPIPVISMKKDVFTKQHILGPLPPGKPERTSSSVPAQTEIGPQPFREVGQSSETLMSHAFNDRNEFNQPLPPHSGLIWPMAWAPRPPYTSPGYNRLGVRQPVGTIQVDRVPTIATRGRTDTKEFDLPTWVSPLYRSYGIGGPFGPFGPFYEPPTIEKVANQPSFRVDRSVSPAKKGKLGRFLDGDKQEWKIVNSNKSMGNFLTILDDNLVAMRRVLRLKNENKDTMFSIVQNLSHILDDAKKFAFKLQEDSLASSSSQVSTDDTYQSD